MKVAMIDPGAVTPFYDEALCSALTAKGAEVTLHTAPFRYCPLPSQRTFKHHEAFSPFLRRNGSFTRLSGTRRLARALAYPFDWSRLRRRLRSDPPRVVHLQWSLNPWIDRHFVTSLKSLGLPLVITAHNSIPHGGEAPSRHGWEALWACADGLIAPSRFTAQGIRQRLPHLASDPRVIPLGHHGPWAGEAHDQRAARQRLGLPPEVPLALFFGLLKPYKGLAQLIEAFALCRAALPTAHLALCGAPRMPLAPLAESLARHRLLEATHRRFAYLDLAESQLWFEAADLVVLPYEGGSQSMIPAMAYTFARPVLATAVAAFPEQVLTGKTGELVPADDVKALGGRLADLLADRDRCRAMGLAGQRFATSAWDWGDIADATLDLYRSVS